MRTRNGNGKYHLQSVMSQHGRRKRHFWSCMAAWLHSLDSLGACKIKEVSAFDILVFDALRQKLVSHVRLIQIILHSSQRHQHFSDSGQTRWGIS